MKRKKNEIRLLLTSITETQELLKTSTSLKKIFFLREN